jgi:hypothetical protein
MLASPTVGWNWVPFSFVFHCSDKILPLFLWCSNPRRALVAVLATLLLLLAIAAFLAAGFFQLGLDDHPPHLSARISPQTPQDSPTRKILGASLPAGLLLMKLQLYLYSAPLLRKLLGASFSAGLLLTLRCRQSRRICSRF